MSGVLGPSAYLLDTNILIEAIRGRASELEDLFVRHEHELATSSIVLAELEYGALNSSSPERSQGAVAAWLGRMAVLDFDAQAAQQAAGVRHRLKCAGTPIGAYDVQIAGHALATGCTLVTNNVRHFSRVEGLIVADWLNS